VKTADLLQDQTYAVVERFSSIPSVGLLLDKALWREKDERDTWDGTSSSTRTRPRTVRKAPKGARIEKSQGWGLTYEKTGLPVLVLKLGAYDFSERAKSNQITESAKTLLERARDTMNIMDLVAEDHDGCVTATIQRSITIRVKTVKGTALKIPAELELMQPRQLTSTWDAYTERKVREDAAKVAIVQSLAEATARSAEQAQGFVTRLTALMGDGDNVHYNASGERYDFHRKWTSDNSSNSRSTYEVSADIIARLLDLAEKGPSA